MLSTGQISLIISSAVIGGGLVANAAVSFYKSNKALRNTELLDNRVTKIENCISTIDERTVNIRDDVKVIKEILLLGKIGDK